MCYHSSGGSLSDCLRCGWDAASGGASANTAAITFPQASGDWSQATHAALYDSAGPTYMIWLDINDLTVLNGEYGRFIAGALDVTLN